MSKDAKPTRWNTSPGDVKILDQSQLPDPNAIQDSQVSDYVDLIDQIPDQDMRELAYQALRHRDRQQVEGLIVEGIPEKDD